ncbi:hypothetical protein [Rubripirellula reticaptiva]|uniref:hypothetical protein n=1 Tax=Rubripirellula reticaptiva TaxID=2528013 RepID=UPI001647E0C5|nr:hypothetical protein [Rubripirellula reticaptiva]
MSTVIGLTPHVFGVFACVSDYCNAGLRIFRSVFALVFWQFKRFDPPLTIATT